MAQPVTNGTLLSIHERANEFANDGLTTGRGWSLAQICEHLALTIQTTVDEGAGDSHPERRGLWPAVQRFVFRQTTLRAAFIPEGIEAPERVCPTATIELDESLSDLLRAAEAFELKIENRSSGWPYHEVLGPMGPRSWRRFHHVHAAHHFAYLQRS